MVFGSGIWGKSTAQHTQPAMDILPREEKTAEQHADQDFKQEMGWNRQTHFCSTEVTGIILYNRYVVLTASFKLWKRTKEA